jgi:hypothetical protein
MNAVTFRRTGFQPVQPVERVENSFYGSALAGIKADVLLTLPIVLVM